ncbi:MAG: hypothetical protein L0177_02180 [Chloroflexi bacterium]|nr:hypothetical protein [Chloroflexota bacterium]
MKLGKHLLKTLALAIAASAALLLGGAASAQNAASIRVINTSVTSEFPEGMRFKAEVDSDVEVESIAVRFRIGQRARGVYEYLTMQKGDVIDSELFLRTNSGANYIPPGTIITYNFEIMGADGNRLDTERQEFIYYDARFEWEEVSQGPVTVAYHGPVQRRAEIVLEAIIQTLGVMGPLLDADTETPIRVTMYNNVLEMLEALPPGSTTIRRELITEGQAFTDDGTLLVLGSGSTARGTASHEVTHILTHRAGDSIISRIPSWLDEGLAEFGNIEPGFSYDIAMEYALSNNVLLPITAMPILPGNPEDVIIFYGQSRNMIRWMITEFGAQAMRELMATLKTGARIDDALREIYGHDRLSLENEWRRSLGAETLSAVERERSLPTPIPRIALQPYTLTPQPSAPGVSSSQPAPPAAAPPPAAEAQPTSTPQPPPPSSEGEEEPASGGGCNPPTHGGPVAADVSGVGLLLGLAGLGLRKRRFRG